VAVFGGASVAHAATNATTEYKLEWNIRNTLQIDSSSKIDVTGRGYLPGYTLGNMPGGRRRLWPRWHGLRDR
jgi:hypothetical protein